MRQQLPAQSNLARRGYAGLRGAPAFAGGRLCGRGLALKCSRMLSAFACAPLAQSASRMHPRNSRVPREISGLKRRDLKFGAIATDVEHLEALNRGVAAGHIHEP